MVQEKSTRMADIEEVVIEKINGLNLKQLKTCGKMSGTGQ